ncbi:MAG: sigma-70 family RNA polymerase sigma factor [Prevotella sp.]|nr:sigma-70 family RNA polymerase sigma factor [Prevotella sp.]
MQDKKTIELLFRKHYGRMLLTARTLLRNQEEAEDVVGDVFETLMYSQQELDMNHVESFLLVSVRNTCLNRIRHRMAAERARQQQPQEAVEEAYAELPLDDILDYIANELKPQTKQVMMLRYNEGKKYADIASDLGISRVAVYKHLNKALKILKKQFTWKD